MHMTVLAAVLAFDEVQRFSVTTFGTRDVV